MWFPEINHILNSSHIIILLPESKDGIAFPCKQGYFWQLNCGLLANDYLMATWLLLFHLFCPVLQNILPPEFQTFQIWGWIKFLRQNNIRYQSPCIEEIKVTDLALHGSLCRRCILFLYPQKWRYQLKLVFCRLTCEPDIGHWVIFPVVLYIPVFLASQDVMYVSESANDGTDRDFTDVTLVNDDTNCFTCFI